MLHSHGTLSLVLQSVIDMHSTKDTRETHHMECCVHSYQWIIAIAQAYMPDKLKRATAAADERSHHGEHPGKNSTLSAAAKQPQRCNSQISYSTASE